MAQPDGSIRIVTKITTKDAEESLASLEWQIKKSAKYMDELRSKMDTLKDQKIPTQEFKDLEEKLKQAYFSLDSLLAKQKELKDMGFLEENIPKSLSSEIDKAGMKVGELEDKILALKEAGKDFVLGKDTTQYKSYEQQLQYEEEAVKKAGEHYQQLLKQTPELQKQSAEEQRIAQIKENAIAANDEIIEKVERLKQLEQEIADLKKAGVTEGYTDYEDRILEAEELKQDIRDYKDSISEVPEKFSRMQDAAQKAFSAIREGFSTIGRLGKKAFLGLAKIAKKAFGAITGGTKKSSSILSTFSSRLKGITLSLLIFNWISKGFNAMISGMKKGFENFAGYSDSYAQSVQDMKNAMSTLGNQFAAAFAPIVQMVIPWINSLINALSTAMTYIAQFIAALTGKNTFIKAVKIQDSYNDSLIGTASAAKKAYGALAKFDDLDVLHKQDGASSSGAANQTLPKDMFEGVEVESKWVNIADWFKKMWENSDFSELGKTIASKIKNALDNIPWDKIKKSAEKIANGITSSINGFINVKGFGYSIGNTISQGINTAFSFLNSYVHTISWAKIGNFISESLNGFFDNINWDLIYDTFVTGAKGIGESINSFIDTFEWSNVSEFISNFIITAADSLREFFKTTEWKKLGEKIGGELKKLLRNKEMWNSIGRAIGSGLQAAFDFVKGILSQLEIEDFISALEELLKGFFEDFDEEGTLALIILGGLAKNLLLNATEDIFSSAALGLGNKIGGSLTTYALPAILAAVGGWNLGNLIGREIFGDEAYDDFTWSEFFKALNPEDFKGAMSEIRKELTIGSEDFEHFKGSIQNVVPAFDEIINAGYNMRMSIVEDTFLPISESLMELTEQSTKTKDNTQENLKAMDKDWEMSKIKIKDTIEIITNNMKKTFSDSYESVLDATNSFINRLSYKLKNIQLIGNNVMSSILPQSVSGYSSVQSEIPALASGAVIRGGNPFMAVLGDQPAGVTNIETPLPTMVEAFKQAMVEMGGAGERVPVNVNLNYDGETFARLSIPDILAELGRQGYDVDVLGVI